MEPKTFPSNNLSYIAACLLTGKVTARRISNYDFELSPGDVALELWRDFLDDKLIFSANLLAKQISACKKTPMEASV